MRKTLLMLVVLTLSVLVVAQEGSTVVGNLTGPMGVLVADDGSVWVIESGLGGDTEIETRSPEGEEVTGQYGVSARIIRVAPDGSQETVATLGSIIVGMETVGGARLALANGTLYATNGYWIEFGGLEAPPMMGVVVRIEDGEVTEVADTWAYEITENPDGFVLESHPYGIAVDSDGSLIIADAGANTLLRVDPDSGEVSLIALFDAIPSPLPNPARANAMNADPVPTGVVVGEDGNYYVSFLPGFPFLPDAAKVVRVTPEGEVSDYATGLSMVTDIAYGPDGHLYAVSFAVFGEQGFTPNSGSVIRLMEGAEHEVLLEGLSFPTALAFNDAGDLFLTLNGVGAPESGSVVRYDAMASGD